MLFRSLAADGRVDDVGTGDRFAVDAVLRAGRIPTAVPVRQEGIARLEQAEGGGNGAE